MVKKFYQGDIVLLDFHPQAGREQSGRRPAVIISNDFFNSLSNIAIVCPISNTKNEFPLNFLLDSRTTTQGSILCQHVKSLDLSARNAVFIEKLPANSFSEVKEIVFSQMA
ncbi:type II toxin-antitoxin system PemK/MazF family toxin [Planococcus salinus]|uniref:Type II toxin-antitoxin system PemK/MazF family toxin n=1 Tax=Planococcus salinus TaxID=1848460 RepID=A0A3M8P5J1_9BACL|nr:type II toxin-antitoxin system PemK/MazF family toxin [Planococcus salinus]RNF38956.1 type II toxin-antitoxin system PemK/MazF family toxin [Planococcus salinus]